MLNKNKMEKKKKKPSISFIPRWKDIKNVKKNWKTVKGSPVASLTFALQIRKMFVAFIILYICYMGFNMIKDYNATGITGTIGKVVLVGVLGWVCYSIYMTIPQAKRQLEYYKRNPEHNEARQLNVKQEIDDILEHFENKERMKGGNQ